LRNGGAGQAGDARYVGAADFAAVKNGLQNKTLIVIARLLVGGFLRIWVHVFDYVCKFYLQRV